MLTKLHLLLDPSPRRMEEIFTPIDLDRLKNLCTVHWAQDEAISLQSADFNTSLADISLESNSTLAELSPKLDLIVGGNWHYGDLAHYPKLRAFIEVSGRHPAPEDFDYSTAFARSIRVLSCAPAFGPQVGEMAVAMAMDAAREISAGDAAFKKGREDYLWDGNRTTFTMFGRTIGLIGYGNLARQVQALLAPYTCAFLAYDPWLPASFMEGSGVKPASLEVLMQESDVVFVLAITSKENKHLVSRRHLESMKQGAVLALMSRAHLVDFDALTDVLYSGCIKAAIDVFPQEPLPADHPIRNAPNVVLSAHRAGSVMADLHLIGRMVVDDVEAICSGIPPRRLQRAEPEIVHRL